MNVILIIFLLILFLKRRHPTGSHMRVHVWNCYNFHPKHGHQINQGYRKVSNLYKCLIYIIMSRLYLPCALFICQVWDVSDNLALAWQGWETGQLNTSEISKGEDTDTLNLGAPVSFGNHNNLQSPVWFESLSFQLDLWTILWNFANCKPK